MIDKRTEMFILVGKTKSIAHRVLAWDNIPSIFIADGCKQLRPRKKIKPEALKEIVQLGEVTLCKNCIR